MYRCCHSCSKILHSDKYCLYMSKVLLEDKKGCIKRKFILSLNILLYSNESHLKKRTWNINSLANNSVPQIESCVNYHSCVLPY